MMEVYYKNRVTYILRACYNKMEKRDNSSARVFAFTAKAVRTCKSGQKKREEGKVRKRRTGKRGEQLYRKKCACIYRGKLCGAAEAGRCGG